jgi:hypothetical protein
MFTLTEVLQNFVVILGRSEIELLQLKIVHRNCELNYDFIVLDNLMIWFEAFEGK